MAALRTDIVESTVAETVTIIGANGEEVGAYVARPDDLTPLRPVNRVEQTPALQVPLLGIFGNRRPEPVARGGERA